MKSPQHTFRRSNDYHSSDSARCSPRDHPWFIRRNRLLDCVGDRMRLNRDNQPRTYRNFYTAAQRGQSQARSVRNATAAVLVILAVLILRAVN